MATAPKFADDTAFRASVVGASEVPALFDQSPWLTRFELWHRKNGTIATPEFNAVADDGTPDNERVYFGVKLEPLVLEAACERWGYRKLPTPKHLDNGRGLGGHPDALVECPKRGRGILEIKTADWLVVKGWGDEPPMHYLLQSQCYQGLAEVTWGDVVVLVGGNKLTRHQYDFRPIIYADMQARVAEFWQSVRDGKPPKPDYRRDGDVIAELNGPARSEAIDLRTWNRGAMLAAEWLDAKAREKAAKIDADACKAEILERVGDAEAALFEGFRLGCGMTKDSAGTLITEEMIGTRVNARRGYRRFDIKEKAL